MLLIVAEKPQSAYRETSGIWFGSSKRFDNARSASCDERNVAAASGFRRAPFIPRMQLSRLLPVANDSCGGSAAVVNYRNWPIELARFPARFQLAPLRLIWVGSSARMMVEGERRANTTLF